MLPLYNADVKTHTIDRNIKLRFFAAGLRLKLQFHLNY